MTDDAAKLRWRNGVLAEQRDHWRESAACGWQEVVEAHQQWCGRCAPGSTWKCVDRDVAEAFLAEALR